MMCWCSTCLENKRGNIIQLQKAQELSDNKLYSYNITVIDTDNHNYCIIMSNITNDSIKKILKLSKILNEYQFTINNAINNKLDHLSHKVTTLIMIINSIK